MRKEVIPIPGEPPARHTSRVVRFGNLVFVGGTTGRDLRTKQLAGDDMTSQARQAMENIKEALGVAGATMADVLKMTCYLADEHEKPAFDEVYCSYFPKDPPARACFQVGSLGPGVKVEIETTAGIPD